MTLDLDFVIRVGLGAVATWRVCHMLLWENGPFRMFRRIRERSGMVYAEDDDTVLVSFKHELLTCIWCASMWVGSGVTLLLFLWPWAPWLLLPLVFSGFSGLVGRRV